jgi:hypothetical protein
LFGSQSAGWQQAILNLFVGDFLWLHFSEAVQAKCANRQARGRRPFNIIALANILNLFTKSCWSRGLTAWDAVPKMDASWNNRLAPSWRKSLFRIAMEGK